jgi:hypothetical protein
MAFWSDQSQNKGRRERDVSSAMTTASYSSDWWSPADPSLAARIILASARRNHHRNGVVSKLFQPARIRCRQN